jgi:beta-lactamase class A
MRRQLIFLLCAWMAACAPATPGVQATPSITEAAARPGLQATFGPAPSATVTVRPGLAATSTDNGAALRGQVEAALAQYPGDWHILVKEVGGQVVYSHQAAQRIDAASVIKIPIALLFFKTIAPRILPALKDYLANKGIDGRTFEQLLHAMLVDSEEEATFSLLSAIRNSHLDVDAALRGWGAVHTDIYLRKSTPEDIVALVEGFYAGNLLTPPERSILLSYMAEYTQADDTRIGVVRKALPCGGQFYNKRGTITQEYLAVADVAILAFPTPAGERAYMIALFAYPAQSGTTYESLVQGMEKMAHIFWGTIKAQTGLPENVACQP